MSAVTIDGPVLPRFGGRDAVVIAFPAERAGGRAAARPVRVPAVAATRLRITRRGRLALTLTATVLAAVAAEVGAGQATAGQEVGSVATADVMVVPGDTLWGIASEVAVPGQDVRDVIAEIVELNALPTSAVTAGQTLVVPVTD